MAIGFLGPARPPFSPVRVLHYSGRQTVGQAESVEVVTRANGFSRIDF